MTQHSSGIMNRRTFLKHSGLFAAAMSLGCRVGVRAQSPSRPNIVVILADDMGYSDLGCYGGEIQTPNLDRLAAGGVRFTQFYNAARCCPTRASLQTGLYPHQADVGHMVYKDEGPGYHGRLNRRCVTLAEVLKGAGYHTMMSGKWHVGHDPGVRPPDRGYDRFYGIHKHVDSYFKVLRGCSIYEGDKEVIPASDELPKTDDPNHPWYTTDVFTDHALTFLDEAVQADKPFFLYLAYNAPHWPLEAPDEDIEKYRGTYTDGWSAVRRERLKRMRQMGLIDRDWELPPDDGPDWETLSAEDRDNLDFRRAIYAAQVDRMDRNIGRVVDRLAKHGAMDNTLILFLSDNGCSAEPERQMFGYRFAQNRVENFASWRTDSGRSASQGLAWANASNTPFRKFKRWTHEGGVATPLIVHWPGGIRKPGRLVHQPGHIIDIMATCVDVSGAVYPKRYGGNAIQPMEGASLKPAFTGGKIARQSPLFWEHEGNWAIRDGRWKLVCDGPKGPRELYDLQTDRTEMHDLAREYPDRVEAMTETWRQWAKQRHVLPWPYKPAWDQTL